MSLLLLREMSTAHGTLSFLRKMLTRSKIGGRVCVSLLDNMVRLYDAEEGTEGAQAFDIGYGAFHAFIST